MENLPFHTTTLRPDKCFLSDIRFKFFGCICKNGHEYTDRNVFYYPEDVFCVEDHDGEKIIFDTFIPLNVDIEPEKSTAPIYMFNYSDPQKMEIIEEGAKKGIEITYKHFLKPKISINYDERLEYELADEIGYEIIPGETPLKEIAEENDQELVGEVIEEG